MAKEKQAPAEQPDQEPLKQALLEHLLKIEAEAAVLVNEAQAEVDRRIAEAERQNRALHEKEFSREAAEREAAYQKEVNSVKSYYDDELDSYRQSLDLVDADTGRFSALMTGLLEGGR
jgi:regulator of protease activity HflC (stomatin/prohibitin superfamily)